MKANECTSKHEVEEEIKAIEKSISDFKKVYGGYVAACYYCAQNKEIKIALLKPTCKVAGCDKPLSMDQLKSFADKNKELNFFTIQIENFKKIQGIRITAVIIPIRKEEDQLMQDKQQGKDGNPMNHDKQQGEIFKNSCNWFFILVDVNDPKLKEEIIFEFPEMNAYVNDNQWLMFLERYICVDIDKFSFYQQNPPSINQDNYMKLINRKYEDKGEKNIIKTHIWTLRIAKFRKDAKSVCIYCCNPTNYARACCKKCGKAIICKECQPPENLIIHKKCPLDCGGKIECLPKVIELV